MQGVNLTCYLESLLTVMPDLAICRPLGASLKSSDYYWPEPEPVALRATGQVSTLTELE